MTQTHTAPTEARDEAGRPGEQCIKIWLRAAPSAAGGASTRPAPRTRARSPLSSSWRSNHVSRVGKLTDPHPANLGVGRVDGHSRCNSAGGLQTQACARCLCVLLVAFVPDGPVRFRPSAFALRLPDAAHDGSGRRFKSGLPSLHGDSIMTMQTKTDDSSALDLSHHCGECGGDFESYTGLKQHSCQVSEV